MKLLLDTSTPECHLLLVGADGSRTQHDWQADRELANGLLTFITDNIQAKNMSLKDISGIGVMQGPGSFTGLRIGMTVANTLADSLNIPIVGAQGEDWTQEVVERLDSGENDKLVMPIYGRDANITSPRK